MKSFIQKHLAGINQILSVILLVIVLSLFAYGSVQARWGGFLRGFFEFLLAVIILNVWIGHLVFTVNRFFKSKYKWLLFACFIIIAYSASFCSCSAHRYVIAYEIQQSVDVGLYEDCMRLLDNWPIKENTISRSTPEYDRLPESIKMLKPVYVTKEVIDLPDVPPNIGICKNGFGGFCMGVRVFRSDQDANTYSKKIEGKCQRIVRGVYFWLHFT